MKIRKQVWLEQEKFIQITLHQPYWVAWRDFGWEETYGRVEGLGISEEAVRLGFKLKKKIRVVVLRYGKYEISPHMAMRRAKELGSRFKARDGKILLVIPRTAFEKIEPTKQNSEKEKIRQESLHKAESRYTVFPINTQTRLL